MNLCSDGHNEVCYEDRNCPCCSEVDVMREQVDALNEEINGLKADITELEIELKNEREEDN